ncbi:MAG: hypothetical protein K8E66_13260 [Phycisphaerales bacterium]|nr:hypothetical protein [Phycisphaerales bacterium]
MNRRLRRQIVPVIGRLRHVGGLAGTRFDGRDRFRDDAVLVAAAWNPVKVSRFTESRRERHGDTHPG